MGICGVAVLLLCSGCNSETALAPSTPQASQYRPTVSKPQEVGERLTDATVYTVDARSKDIWMYFDFSRGAVVGVQNPKTDDWDIAFQRHTLRTNGGDTNPSGQGAILALPEADFAAVKAVPEEAEFVGDVRTKKRLHAYNPALQKWYSYSYTTNILIPKPVVYIVRTQDGKYAKMRILSYYCKDDVAGCVTFEYVYQGDGSPSFAASSARLSGAPGPR
jgi:hypothetical protein